MPATEVDGRQTEGLRGISTLAWFLEMLSDQRKAQQANERLLRH